jgi:hypothetical protein
MATSFPAIRPASRRYRLPVFAVTEAKAQSGATSLRLWSSKPEDARLELRFTNIPDSQALEIGQAYLDAKGPVDSLTLPNALFSGADASLRHFIKAAGTGLTWHFTKEPPDVESVVNGVSNISVTLVGQLRI